MKVQDLSNLISIRNFMVVSIDNLNIKLSKEQVRALQDKIGYLDREIITHALKLDLSKLDQPDTVTRLLMEVESTEDVEKVAEKFVNGTAKETSEQESKGENL